ncbi:motility associated factor glycosyltransferase family protein [Bermanella marisrubri]|uniref:Motility associated factor glycosyltransferase family protein n=1 Tax=Bermanella marisrubri TaxID=207949 RepID=Q1N2Y4_9GAMM|nr:6-hydroxymethylpterin diphosphokinase MptE-like protein [Bermanella marisrubri]EAT12535.1 hypothetical protein RED65_06558 [Oceanobacter sp. RED65] [Bermanella marisrubri]QIZ84907.1 motility associated factor glycosyltransferase family protein [Bermanella marisrubri]
MSKIPKILEELYFKNLEFFKVQNPQIYNVITNTTPDHTNIIISDEGKIDLKYKGRGIYGGDAIQYVENEVEEFNDIYKSGVRTTPFRALVPGSYNSPRFFHSHINQTAIELYETAEEVYPKILHTQKNNHDFLVMMGIGLGLQITELLEHVEVQNLLILETDYELLTLSCFFTDWEEIYKIQSPKKNKSISLVLLNKQIVENEQSGIWNELIKRAPHFPYNTVFYNHGRHDKYGEIIKKINEDLQMYLSLWGFYDDEVNQLNHILHNIDDGMKLIPKSHQFKWTKPVIVCGSGPSLDDHFDQLVNIRNSCILISAGTSIKSLLNYGLVPDYHIEIESDYEVYPVLKDIGEDKTKNITLISAIQCSPFLKRLFKESYCFVKDSLSIGSIIEGKDNKLVEPTPTCVNAALSFAFHYRAEKIFLFGTDFGFYDASNHHSKKSIYFDDNIESEEINTIKDIAEATVTDNFVREGYKGDCLTTSTYYTTKRRIDMAINYFKARYKFELFNCSDGLIINNSTHIQIGEPIEIKIEPKDDDTNEFRVHTRSIPLTLKKDIKDNLYEPIKEVCYLYAKFLDKMEYNLSSLSSTCWAISNHINTSFYNEHGSLMYFFRGTIWHYSFSGYSIAYSCKPENQAEVIKKWKDRFKSFLLELPENLLSVIQKDRTTEEAISDLKRTIRE